MRELYIWLRPFLSVIGFSLVAIFIMFVLGYLVVRI